MTTLVKICGITNLDDAMDAVDCGADLLGFNFWPDSPRYVDPETAHEIIAEVPGSVSKVGIFVNADTPSMIEIAVELELDFLQLHGDETPEVCNAIGRPWFKAFRPKDEKDLLEIPKYQSEWLLVDAAVTKAFGGTGVVSNWDLARESKKYGSLFLSGGLKPENVELAIRSVHPYAVDAASGVESSPGVKDRNRVEEFIRRAKYTSSSKSPLP